MGAELSHAWAGNLKGGIPESRTSPFARKFARLYARAFNKLYKIEKRIFSRGVAGNPPPEPRTQLVVVRVAPGQDDAATVSRGAAAEQAQEKLQMAGKRFLSSQAIRFLPEHRKPIFAQGPVRWRGPTRPLFRFNGGKPGENGEQCVNKGLLAAKIREAAKGSGIFKRPGHKRRVPKETTRNRLILRSRNFHGEPPPVKQPRHLLTTSQERRQVP
jgi:hypothetical protein